MWGRLNPITPLLACPLVGPPPNLSRPLKRAEGEWECILNEHVLFLYDVVMSTPIYIPSCSSVSSPLYGGSAHDRYLDVVRVLATYCMFSKDEILRFCSDASMWMDPLMMKRSSWSCSAECFKKEGPRFYHMDNRSVLIKGLQLLILNNLPDLPAPAPCSSLLLPRANSALQLRRI